LLVETLLLFFKSLLLRFCSFFFLLLADLLFLGGCTTSLGEKQHNKMFPNNNLFQGNHSFINYDAQILPGQSFNGKQQVLTNHQPQFQLLPSGFFEQNIMNLNLNNSSNYNEINALPYKIPGLNEINAPQLPILSVQEEKTQHDLKKLQIEHKELKKEVEYLTQKKEVEDLTQKLNNSLRGYNNSIYTQDARSNNFFFNLKEVNEGNTPNNQGSSNITLKKNNNPQLGQKKKRKGPRRPPIPQYYTNNIKENNLLISLFQPKVTEGDNLINSLPLIESVNPLEENSQELSNLNTGVENKVIKKKRRRSRIKTSKNNLKDEINKTGSLKIKNEKTSKSANSKKKKLQNLNNKLLKNNNNVSTNNGIQKQKECQKVKKKKQKQGIQKYLRQSLLQERLINWYLRKSIKKLLLRKF